MRDAAGVLNLESSVDEAAFTQAIHRIQEAIRAGETYQVNYSYRLHGQAYGSPVGLYRRLRALQPVAFGAYIQLPGAEAQHPRDAETTHVLSCSPELFLRHEDGLLTARPMKGTASRTRTPEADSETARHLSLDVKNRAENLMIVDLLRNDLGRIAQTGSVRVPDLFAIEPYPTVFQMTSTVQARVRPEVDFPALLRAVFPCGSITGAPKHHTMDWIARLESTPRGLYCGTIGWVDAPQGDARLGSFCLSVAIRTITLGAQASGLRPARLGIGAGIVLDSQVDEEFEECRLKSRFLTGLPPGFELFETMRATRGDGVAHLELHLARLGRSAQVLGFAFDRDAAQRLIESRLRGLAHETHQQHRLRLSLSHDGRLLLTQAVLSELPPGSDGDTSPAELPAAGCPQDHAAPALRRRRARSRARRRVRQPVLHRGRAPCGGRAQFGVPEAGRPLVHPPGHRRRPARRHARPGARRSAVAGHRTQPERCGPRLRRGHHGVQRLARHLVGTAEARMTGLAPQDPDRRVWLASRLLSCGMSSQAGRLGR